MFIPTEITKEIKTPLPADGSHPMADHPNVTAIIAPTNSFAVPGAADVVWIRQNYHDIYDPFMAPADVPTFDKAVFKALKRGGLFVVIDHSAPDGTGIASTNTTHHQESYMHSLPLLAHQWQHAIINSHKHQTQIGQRPF